MRDKQGRRVLQNLLNPQPKNAPPPEPIEPDPELDELIADFNAYEDQEEAEILAIKEARPLGSVVHREPKSLLYSKVPDPVWKRKLRP